VKAQHGLARMS